MEMDKVDNDLDQSLLQQFSCLGTTDKEVLIKELQSFVNVNENNASFLLEMNNWNLQESINSFFELGCSDPLPSMSVLGDITVGDGEAIPPCTKFNKTWRVQNTGDEVWPRGCYLRFCGGEKLCEEDKIHVLPVGPGCTTDLSFNLTSPKEPGIYESSWKMVTPSGVFFGDVIWVILTVAEGGTMALTQQLSRFSDLGTPVLECSTTNPFASQGRMST